MAETDIIIEPKQVLSYTSSTSGGRSYQNTRKMVTSKFTLSVKGNQYNLYQQLKVSDDFGASKKYSAVDLLDSDDNIVITIQMGDVFDDIVFLFVSVLKDSDELILVFLSTLFIMESESLKSQGNHKNIFI